MSLTPVIPSEIVTKSFWQKPEGTAGKIAIAIGAGIIGLVFWFFLVPFVVIILQNTFLALVYGTGTFIVGALLLHPKVHRLIGNVFRSTMRAITGFFIELDPIGMLKNVRDRANENLAKFGIAIEQVSGSKAKLEAKMKKNTTDALRARDLAKQAENKLATETDVLRKQNYLLSRSNQLQEVSRKERSNTKLREVYNTVVRLYNMLTRVQMYTEYTVTNLNGTIENAEAERDTILSAYRGMSFAKKLMHGDPQDVQAMNDTLNYLADSNATMMGEMEDIFRYGEKFITNMDMEQGADMSDAEAILAQFDAKLLTAGVPTQTVPMSMPQADGVLVARAANSTGSNVLDPDYINDILK